MFRGLSTIPRIGDNQLVSENQIIYAKTLSISLQAELAFVQSISRGQAVARRTLADKFKAYFGRAARVFAPALVLELVGEITLGLIAEMIEEISKETPSSQDGLAWQLYKFPLTELHSIIEAGAWTAACRWEYSIDHRLLDQAAIIQYAELGSVRIVEYLIREKKNITIENINIGLIKGGRFGSNGRISEHRLACQPAFKLKDFTAESAYAHAGYSQSHWVSNQQSRLETTFYIHEKHTETYNRKIFPGLKKYNYGWVKFINNKERKKKDPNGKRPKYGYVHMPSDWNAESPGWSGAPLGKHLAHAEFSDWQRTRRTIYVTAEMIKTYLFEMQRDEQEANEQKNDEVVWQPQAFAAWLGQQLGHVSQPHFLQAVFSGIIEGEADNKVNMCLGDFRGVNFSQVRFKHVHLGLFQNANFTSAHFEDVVADEDALNGATLDNTTIINSQLRCQWLGTQVCYAKLYNSDIGHHIALGSEWLGTYFDEATQQRFSETQQAQAQKIKDTFQRLAEIDEKVVDIETVNKGMIEEIKMLDEQVDALSMQLQKQDQQLSAVEEIITTHDEELRESKRERQQTTDQLQQHKQTLATQVSHSIVTSFLTSQAIQLMDEKISAVSDRVDIQISEEGSELLGKTGNECLDLLLGTAVIRALSGNDRRRIINYANDKEKDLLKDFILAKVGQVGIKKISAEMQETKGDEDYDFDSVISELIGFEEDDRFERYLDMEASFFKGKMLYIFDPEKEFAKQGEILRVEEKKESRTYYLEGDVIFHVSLNESDQIIHCDVYSKIQYNLLDSLQHSMVQNTISYLNIEPCRNNPLGGDSLIPGSYQLFRYGEQEEFGPGLFKRLKRGTHGIGKKIGIVGNTTEQELTLMGKSYRQCFKLVNTENPWIKYLIYLHFSGSIYNAQKVVITQIHGNREVNEKELGIYEVKHYPVLVTHKTALGNWEHVKVREKVINEQEIKLKKLEKINQHNDQLIDLLQQPNHQHYLNYVLDHIMNNALTKGLSEHLLQVLQKTIPNFNQTVTTICELHHAVNIPVTPAEVLKDVALKANYGRLIQKNQSLIVLKTMKLLEQAFEHINLISGREVVLFMGNTGAGKSTSINYFAGYPLKIMLNKYGQSIVEIDESQLTEAGNQPSAVNTYAKIGQSIGTSQTAFVHGHKFYQGKNKAVDIDKTIMFADTPGFDDTRGPDYQLSAMLSIDQCIKKVNIRSVVLTVPYESFLVDRANLIVRLFINLEERMPSILNPNSNVRGSIFLLITKHAAHKQASSSFSGRLAEHLMEEQKRLADLSSEDRQSNEFGMEIIKKRVSIWQMLNSMQEGKRIIFIDISNNIGRTKILRRFVNSPGISADSFNNKLDRSDIKSRFGKYIELSTDTWQRMIMQTYLEIIPDEIDNCQRAIAQMETKNKAIAQESQNKLIAIDNLQRQIDAVKSKIIELQTAQADPDVKVEDTALVAQLHTARQQGLEKQRDELSELNKKLLKQKEILADKEAEIKKQENTIQQAQDRINQVKDEIKNLESGSQVKLLWKDCEENRDPVMVIVTLKKNALERRRNEVQEMTDDDYVPGSRRKVEAGTYKGELYHHAYISQEYRIVPKNKMQRNEFLASGNAGKYIATLTGFRYVKHLPPKAHPDGKRMVYSFKTLWKGDGEMPWIRIEHTIPNVDLNEATIINGIAEMAAQNEAMARATSEKKQLTEERHPIATKIAAIEVEIATIEAYMQREGNKIARATVSTLIDEYVTNNAEDARRIAKEQDEISSNDKTVVQNCRKIDTLQRKIQMHKKRKRYFALLIQDQRNIAKLLRDFSRFVLGDELGLDKYTQSEGLSSQCRQYIDYYNANEQKMIDACEQDLSTQAPQLDGDVVDDGFYQFFFGNFGNPSLPEQQPEGADNESMPDSQQKQDDSKAEELPSSEHREDSSSAEAIVSSAGLFSRTNPAAILSRQLGSASLDDVSQMAASLKHSH